MKNNSNESITQCVLNVPKEFAKNKRFEVKALNVEKVPSFYRIAKAKGFDMDLLDIVAELPKQEKDVVLFIKNNIQYNVSTNEYVPMVCIKQLKETMTSTQKQSLSRALSSLIERKVIGKLKTNYYMINPDLLVPQNYEKWKLIFEEPEKMIPKY